MGLTKLLNKVQIWAVLCLQWGDSGKGKYSHYFGEWADVTGRGTGGNNAGHTIILNDREKIFNFLTSSIVYDSLGKINILGNGMVIELKGLSGELDALSAEGFTYNNLMISKDASVIMPYHINEDIARNKSQAKGGIGTTCKGIGPCYGDKIGRSSNVMIGDLFYKDVLARKIEKAKERYPEQKIDIEEIISYLEPYAEKIEPFVRDTVTEMHNLISQGKRILLEGAQGLLLSVEHGTTPYVTSSDCSINGTASGVGISASIIDLTLGVVKFPFMTRVGAGPFPTEFGGEQSEKYCSDDLHKLKFELDTYQIPYEQNNGDIIYDRHHKKIIEMINANDLFIRGVGIRLAAGEYGATTKRPRRIGRTDAVAARYAVRINGPQKLILTKADALAGTEQFQLCYKYQIGSNTTEDFDKNCERLRRVHSIYKTYEGYSDITGETNYGKLPNSLKTSISDFEKFVGAEAAIISTGQAKEQTIVR
jgi:adenylosuccinate synthase